MLILTRKPSESLIIGDDIKVTVLGIRGNQVRIGIDAPPNVSVDREEIRDRKDRGEPPPGHMSDNGNGERR